MQSYDELKIKFAIWFDDVPDIKAAILVKSGGASFLQPPDEKGEDIERSSVKSAISRENQLFRY